MDTFILSVERNLEMHKKDDPENNAMDFTEIMN